MEATREFVSLPVPAQYFDAMVQHLAELVATAQSSNQPTATPRPRPAAQTLPLVPWTAAEIAALDGMADKPGPRALMDLAAERGVGVRVPLPDILARTGLSHDALRSQLGGLSRRVHHHFGRRNLPWEVDWSSGKAAYYIGSADIAQWWLSAQSK